MVHAYPNYISATRQPNKSHLTNGRSVEGRGAGHFENFFTFQYLFSAKFIEYSRPSAPITNELYKIWSGRGAGKSGRETPPQKTLILYRGLFFTFSTFQDRTRKRDKNGAQLLSRAPSRAPYIRVFNPLPPSYLIENYKKPHIVELSTYQIDIYLTPPPPPYILYIWSISNQRPYKNTMITQAIEKIAFLKITKGILENTNDGGLVDVFDCINYLKRKGIKTNDQAIAHYKELTNK